MSFSRLIRFIPEDDHSVVLIGEPVDPDLDIGRATRNGHTVEARLFSGKSALRIGELTDQKEKIKRLLSPLSQEEIGTIRCIGLNYQQHAREIDMPEPDVPVLFMKPQRL